MATVILPYRTDWREMSAVLEYAKGTGADRSSLDTRFGGGESLRETLNALEQLALIDRDDVGDVRLNQRGNQIAYATDTESQRGLVVQALLDYSPYRIPLERAVAEHREILEGPWIENIWQVDMGLNQPRNRVEEARTFFFRLVDDATSLGAYRRGVRGQVTRLEFADRALDMFADRLGLGSERVADPAQQESSTGADNTAFSSSLIDGKPDSDAMGISITRGAVQIQASVDMTDWDLEKIGAFLKLVGFPEVKNAT